MKNKLILSILLIAWLAAMATTPAQDLTQELTVEPRPCKKSLVKRPMLKAERGWESNEAIRTGWYAPLIADFNGDGWCDFAWAVPYPVNSKMESYWLEDILVLAGRKRWFSPLRGKKSWSDEIGSLEPMTWPMHQVDLTSVVLIYEKAGGAPYVLGLKSGHDLGQKLVKPGCREYSGVYRWDNEVDAFKKVDDATRDAVIAFYYSAIGRRCEQPKK